MLRQKFFQELRKLFEMTLVEFVFASAFDVVLGRGAPGRG